MAEEAGMQKVHACRYQLYEREGKSWCSPWATWLAAWPANQPRSSCRQAGCAPQPSWWQAIFPQGAGASRPLTREDVGGCLPAWFRFRLQSGRMA